MNLRFAAHSIRLRVSTEEFQQLQSGKSLGLEVPLPRGHVFRVKVNQSSTSEWQFDSDPTGLWLSVPRAELEALANALPTREGVTRSFPTHQGDLQVSVEVDVKSTQPRT